MKYTNKTPYYYKNSLIAENNDIIEINGNTVINKQKRIDFTLPDEIIDELLSICDPLDQFDIINEEKSTLRISDKTYCDLKRLGIINDDVRNNNCGNSNYSKHIIQPWSIWIDYNLNPWDADIVKRVLRTKEEPGLTEKQSRILDYKKIIHICQERIRQLENC